MKRIIHLLLVFAGCAGLAAAPAETSAARPARDSFVFEQAGLHVKVWHYAPAGLGADAPVVIVLHGVQRNGEDYLNDWAQYADQHHFLLIVPEFSQAEFPGDEGYNYGNTVDKSGQARPRAQWAFSMIDPIFDAVRAKTGNQRATYFLYGHSAGAQFVQRFIYFMPAARYARAIEANAGWYMLPDLAVAFPYGLKGAPVGEADLRTALGRPLTVLLGEADTDTTSKVLRHTPEAEAQGPQRFARGQYFFRHAQAAAAALPTPFGWSLATAPGVGHSDKGMASFAVRCLFPDEISPNKP